MEPNIIKLKRMSENKIRKMFYIPEVKEHVAKMQIALTNWILDKYASDGYIILDPMCGVGTTLVEAIRKFPRSAIVGYELEEKFVKMAQANIEKTRKAHAGGLFKTEMPPNIDVYLGDARNMKKIGSDCIDLVVTSPPYGEQVKGGEDYGKRKERLIKAGYSEDYCMLKEGYSGQGAVDWQYSDNPNNIGNLKYGDVDFLAEKSYLSEMYKVYQECFRVLTRHGIMVLVTKNFIRDGKQIRLDLDTIKLCGIAGLKLRYHHLREVKEQSFWRNLYKQQWEKDHPDEECPVPKYEDVLVFERTREGSPGHGDGIFGHYGGVHFVPPDPVPEPNPTITHSGGATIDWVRYSQLERPEPARSEIPSADSLSSEDVRRAVEGIREQEARRTYEAQMAEVQRMRHQSVTGGIVGLSAAMARYYQGAPCPMTIEVDSAEEDAATWIPTGGGT